MDAGSTPASSTTFNALETEKNQATAIDFNGCGFFASKAQLVSNSLDWAPKCHHSDTFQFDALNGVGTKECHKYREKIFNNHPFLATALATNYLKIYRQKSLREANLFIGRLDKELWANDLNLSSSSHEIKAFSEKISKRCSFLVVEHGENKQALLLCLSIAKKYTIDTTSLETKGVGPALQRLSCANWWYKNLNTLRVRLIEQVKRQLSIVSKQGQCYASEFALENRQVQLKNSLKYLNETEIVNDEGQKYSLLDIYNKSVSNPRIRKAELMTRIRGL